MARRPDPLQQRLDAVRALRDDPTSPETLDALRRLLKLRTSHVVAAAADHVTEHRLDGFEDLLVAAYEHFERKPVERDPGCTAKAAVVRALEALGTRRDDLLRRAIRTVQLEPSWGRPVDTATAVRAHAAMALVNTGAPDVPVLLAELLTDELPVCRSAAIQALAAWGDPVLLQALLRLRLRLFSKQGEPEEPDVAADAFEALLAVDDEDARAWVLEHLAAPGPYAEAAALALGAARIASALPALVDWWERTLDAGLRRVALVSMGLLRSDESVDFLLERVRSDAQGPAADAVEALAVVAHDPALRARIVEAARANPRARLDEALARLPQD